MRPLYELRSPSPALAPFIEHYWFVHGPDPVDLRVDVFVDGRADLVFNFGASYVREVIGGPRRRLARSNLDAQRLVPIRIVQRGRVRTTGVRFRLGGLAPFVTTPLRTLTGRIAPPREPLGPEARALEAALAQTLQPDTQVRLLDDFFLSRLARAPDLSAFRRALAAAVVEGGGASLDVLADAAGVSARQVERLFARHLGISPKQLGRILRFQSTLRALMREPGCTLGEVAARAGYYDQSHFVKEFKRLSGGVPRGYRGYYPARGPSDFAPNVVVFVQGPARRGR